MILNKLKILMYKTKRYIRAYCTDFFKYSFTKRDIVFHNWMGNNFIRDFWFIPFIENRKISISNKLIFTSVFGIRSPFLKHFKRKKIFFTGENVEKTTISPEMKQYSDHLIEEVDLVLGFSYVEHSKYLRFPLWLRYLVAPTDSLEDIQRKINKINNPLHRLNVNRNKFASLIARHDMTGLRLKMLNIFQKIGKIECPGKFMKNTNELQERFRDNKKEYLSQFKFNICPENSNEKGYITEKIFESIMSGCIPIYWGGNTKEDIEPQILNKEAFLYYEEGKEEELLEKVKKLVSDEQAYQNFCKISPFKEGAAELIWEWICELEKRLKYLQK